jgi:hypothetical protein
MARIIHYTVRGYNDKILKFDPNVDFTKNTFAKMIEGTIKDGKIQGFGRHIEGDQVQVGYYKQGLPFGKFQEYEQGFLMKSGIVDRVNNEGSDDPWIESKEIRSFLQNE